MEGFHFQRYWSAPTDIGTGPETTSERLEQLQRMGRRFPVPPSVAQYIPVRHDVVTEFETAPLNDMHDFSSGPDFPKDIPFGD